MAYLKSLDCPITKERCPRIVDVHANYFSEHEELPENATQTQIDNRVTDTTKGHIQYARIVILAGLEPGRCMEAISACGADSLYRAKK